jgi:hypothetical protein
MCWKVHTQTGPLRALHEVDPNLASWVKVLGRHDSANMMPVDTSCQEVPEEHVGPSHFWGARSYPEHQFRHLELVSGVVLLQKRYGNDKSTAVAIVV